MFVSFIFYFDMYSFSRRFYPKRLPRESFTKVVTDHNNEIAPKTLWVAKTWSIHCEKQISANGKNHKSMQLNKLQFNKNKMVYFYHVQCWRGGSPRWMLGLMLGNTNSMRPHNFLFLLQLGADSAKLRQPNAPQITTHLPQHNLSLFPFEAASADAHHV